MVSSPTNDSREIKGDLRSTVPPEDLKTLKWISSSDSELESWLHPSINMCILSTSFGGFATVYCLHEDTTAKRIARKVYRGVGPRGISQEDIENEVKAMKDLSSHQHIIEILGYGSLGEHSGSYFIDMEYCDCNLDEYIRGTPQALSIPVLLLHPYPKAKEEGRLSLIICAIIQQVLSGLVFVHHQGKVHRDLKPQNILYSARTGWWKIADFGITSDAMTAKLKTTAQKRGTHGYRPPEILRDKAQYSKLTDIWSLGCILYELCTSKPAFANDFQTFDFRSTQSLPFPFVSGLSDKFKSEASSWIQEMLQREPSSRPTAAALIGKFEDLIKTATDIPIRKAETADYWVSEGTDFVRGIIYQFSKNEDVERIANDFPKETLTPNIRNFDPPVSYHVNHARSARKRRSDERSPERLPPRWSDPTPRRPVKRPRRWDDRVYFENEVPVAREVSLSSVLAYLETRDLKPLRRQSFDVET